MNESEVILRVLRVTITLALTAALYACVTTQSDSQKILVSSNITQTSYSEPTVPEPPKATVPPPPEPPLPVASPGSSAAPNAVTQSNPSQWNFWVSTDWNLRKIPDVAKTITIGNTLHYLHFRLSTIDLSKGRPGVAGALVSPELKSFIDEQIKIQAPNPEFIAVAFAADPSALEISPDDKVQGFKIDLDALRNNPPTDTANLQETENIAERVQAAIISEFNVAFTARRPGTHLLSIVIIDKQSGIPMQAMTIGVRPESSGDEQIKDHSQNAAIQIAPGTTTDFSLVLQDLSSINGPSLIGVLSARLPGRSTPQLIAWNTGYTLEQLQSTLDALRNSKKEPVDGPVLDTFSVNFGKSVFEPLVSDEPAMTEANREAGLLARKLIVDAISAVPRGKPSTLMVRIVPSTNQAKYQSPTLPIGAIAFDLPDQPPVYLGNNMIVSLLLPGQSLSSDTICPATWYVARPPDAAATDVISIATRNSGNFWTMTQTVEKKQDIRLSQLQTFLGDRRAPEAPYVLTYLGHNSIQGELYINKALGRIQPTSIERPFSPSSIAILDACETGTSNISIGTPIGKLSALKVGSTIGTWAPVSGEIAGAYLSCMTAILSTRPQLTIGELNLATTQCLFKERNFGATAMKFFLVGNPNQSICSPGRQQ